MRDSGNSGSTFLGHYRAEMPDRGASLSGDNDTSSVAMKPGPSAAADESLWERLIRRLTRHFEDPETCITRVVVWTGDERDRGTQILRFRAEHVGDWDDATLHVVALAKSEAVYRHLHDLLPLRLSEPPSQLLLEATDVNETPPALMAGRFPIMADAAVGIVSVLVALQAPFGHVAVYTKVESQPAVTVLRQARRYRSAPSGNCAECGRPLSDPESLRIGFGPECFRRLHPHLRRLVGQPVLPNIVRLASSSLPRWSAEVDLEWTIAQRTGHT